MPIVITIIICLTAFVIAETILGVYMKIEREKISQGDKIVDQQMKLQEQLDRMNQERHGDMLGNMLSNYIKNNMED